MWSISHPTITASISQWSHNVYRNNSDFDSNANGLLAGTNYLRPLPDASIWITVSAPGRKYASVTDQLIVDSNTLSYDEFRAKIVSFLIRLHSFVFAEGFDMK